MGRYVDKYGPRNPLLFGVIVLAISTFVFAYGVSLSNLDYAYAVAIIARSVQGLASASTMSAGMTLCALTHVESIRGTAMGIAMAGVAFGTLLGPPLGGILSFYTNYSIPFVIVGCILVFNFISQLLILHELNFLCAFPCRCVSTHDEIASGHCFLFPVITSVVYVDVEEQEALVRTKSISPDNVQDDLAFSNSINIFKSLFTLLSDKNVFTLILVTCTGNSVLAMMEPLIPLYLNDQFNENILNEGLIFGCATLSYLLLTPFAGLISDRYPKWLALCIGLCSLSSGLFLLLFSFVALEIVCVSLVLVGIGMAFVDTPTLPFLSEIVTVRIF
jgi:DHA1 family solute carrier family 18 vesicular amine transporter 1/2